MSLSSMKLVLLSCLFTGLTATVYGSSWSTGRCTADYESEWPEDLWNSQLTWRKNNLDGSPIYRFELPEALRSGHVEAGSTHVFSLVSNSPNATFRRHLISVFPSGAHSLEKKCSTGRLRASLDSSELMSDFCPHYLHEKDLRPDLNRTEVMWTAPDCGCVKFKAQVMRDESDIYSFDNDEFDQLKFYVCAWDEDVDPAINDIDPDTQVKQADLLFDDYASEEVVILKELDVAQKQRADGSSQLDDFQPSQKQWRKQSRLGTRWCCQQGKAAAKAAFRQVAAKYDKYPSRKITNYALNEYSISETICEAEYARCGDKKMKKLTDRKFKKRQLKRRKQMRKMKKNDWNLRKKLRKGRFAKDMP